MKDYKDVWNNLSESFSDANFYVWGIGEEEELRRNGAITADFLRQVLDISPDSRVLEIGCGIARIGRELAPLCGEWHGADISSNMIAYAAERTADVPNVYLHELPDTTLGIFPDNYFDCVYSTIVFMHLDKLDMFRYMQEANRVLAPGGRAYFDTYNILAPEAWGEFVHLLQVYSPATRPQYMSQFSTPQEMEKFMQEAGFDSVQVKGDNPQLVVAVGRKPEQPGFVRVESLAGRTVDTSQIAAGEESEDIRHEDDLSAPAEVINLIAAKKSLETDVINLIAVRKALRTEVAQLKEYTETQSDYIRKLEGTLDEKISYVEDLENRLNAFDKAVLKSRKIRRAGLLFGAAVLLGRAVLGKRKA